MATPKLINIALSPMIVVNPEPIFGFIKVFILMKCLSTHLDSGEAIIAQSNLTLVRLRLVPSTVTPVLVLLRVVAVPLKLSRSVVRRLHNGPRCLILCWVPVVRVRSPPSRVPVPLISV